MLAYRTNAAMPKKPMHDADATDRARIAQATGYTTSFFLGSGKWDKHPSPALERAREVARQMMADPDYAATGRKPIVYAHLPDGSEVVVPDDYQVGEIQGEHSLLPIEFKPTAANAGPMAIGGRALHRDGKPMVAADLQSGAAVSFDPSTGAVLSVVQFPLSAFPGLKKLSQRHMDMLEAAQAGSLPTPPDFTAETHKNYRAKLKRLTDAVAAGDVAALESVDIKPVCSSSRPLARYRNLAVIALKARAARRGQA
jgi:hypothetical protein